MPRTQTLPRTTAAYARSNTRRTRRTLEAVTAAWSRIGLDLDAGWSLVGDRILDVVDAAQLEAARAGWEYVPAVLAETGQRVRDPEYHLRVRSLVGTAGDGRSTEGLLYGAVTTAKTAAGEGATIHQARQRGLMFLQGAVATVLSDTRRTSEKVAMASRHVGLWVRALNPPSCGRCVILAGRKYRTRQAFLRHPNCDCTNIPATEALAEDLMVDPHAYLDHLDDRDLARTLGSRANAEAWRAGADVNQLINAYRARWTPRGYVGSVRSAQVFGRNVRYTTEGWTRSGQAYRRYVAATGHAPPGPRLMPETIFGIADDREDALRLLRLYGWV